MQIIGPQNLSQQSYAIARQITTSHQGGVLYWIVEDEHVVDVAAKQISFFAELFGIRQKGYPLDPARQDYSAMLSRLLSHQPGIYVVTRDHFEHIERDISLLREDTWTVKAGERLTPVSVKKRLADLGYERESEHPYAFQAKGGVIEVTVGEQSYRLVFSEEELERVQDLTHGGDLREIPLMPAELDTSVVPFKQEPMPRGTVIASDQMRLPSKAAEFEQIRFVTFRSQLKEEQEVVEYQFTPIRKYRRDFAKFKSDLSKSVENKQNVSVSAMDAGILESAFKQHDIPTAGVRMQEQPVALEGFQDEDNDFLLITHAEIFGRKKPSKKKKRDEQAFLSKLQVNDYVVHEDHGVARYLGITETEIEGYKRENIILEYAKGDKLYVPVELAYKVDKYIGEAKPSLQRLSGTSWARMSRRASQDSREFARKLLNIHAKRSLVEISPWTIYQDADRELHESFGFKETPDQEQSIQEVYDELKAGEPMDRLIVGDVGFGKTEVAIRAAYQAVLNKKQVALLCPTTLLAQQHYDRFKERLAPLGVRVEMLSRFTGRTEKTPDKKVNELVSELNEGKIDVVIGTHRLLSQDVDFNDVGLVIIDEEQRFGVRHKEKLKGLRSKVHILTLSATPIPRTLHFSLSGLREMSLIKTPPKGRQPIETAIQEYNPQLIKRALERELERGGQAFYLYNKVQSIQTMKKKLQDLLGKHVRIDVVHGQMPPNEMARVAAQMDNGEIDVLVCSTIIENGLDLPNVNTLIVHDATRFGIGQLYQIRGRIGRGSAKAYAHFFYPESGITGVAAKRLQILEEAKELGSGFELATRDLEMRGMGQLLGQKQHGQVQKVGLSLYGKLLRQAVEEMETGEIEKEKKMVAINLPLEYGIPSTLFDDPEERLRLYQKLSAAGDKAEMEEILAPYDNAIKQLSENEQARVENLVKILALRFKAAETPLQSIDYQQIGRPDGAVKQQLEIAFASLKTEHVDALVPFFPDFRVKDEKIVISGEEIEDYMVAAEQVIGALAER